MQGVGSQPEGAVGTFGICIRDGVCLRRVSRVLQALVASAFSVSARELRAATRRSAPVAFARQNAMYLAHVALGWSYSEIGRAFGRDRTTAAYACRQVEERREDPAFDAALRALEEVILRSPRDHAVRREGAV